MADQRSWLGYPVDEEDGNFEGDQIGQMFRTFTAVLCVPATRRVCTVDFKTTPEARFVEEMSMKWLAQIVCVAGSLTCFGCSAAPTLAAPATPVASLTCHDALGVHGPRAASGSIPADFSPTEAIWCRLEPDATRIRERRNHSTETVLPLLPQPSIVDQRDSACGASQATKHALILKSEGGYMNYYLPGLPCYTPDLDPDLGKVNWETDTLVPL